MSTAKKITLVVVILLVIGGIWYLESLKVHPTGTSGQAVQALNINPDAPEIPDVGASSSAFTNATTVIAAPSVAGTIPPTAATPAAGSPTTYNTQTALRFIAAADKAAGDQPAIEIVDPTGFINTTSNFKLANYIGHDVILLDFWTYSCINCVRTIPYLNAWYSKYKDQGLIIVGIHTPEFDFEKNLANVRNAVQEYGIQYPVILDSNQGTWNAYNNLYWPHEYLIDMAGYIVHDQVGEGGYTDTEADIQRLLAQRATIAGTDVSAIATSTVNISPANLGEINSPETYFGAARNSLLANGTFFVNGNQTLTTPAASTVKLNNLYLSGKWDFEDQYATNLTSGATITYEYNAGMFT